jgi:hypothetical protein
MYKIKYVDGYQPVDESPYLVFGDAFHKGIEQLARGESLTKARVAFTERAFSSGVLKEEDILIGELLIIAYQGRYANDGLTFEKVEELEEAVLGYGYEGDRIRVRFDGVVKTKDGKRYAIEHKTTRQDITDGSIYWDRRELDVQMGLYDMLAKKNNMGLDGFLYDVIRVPQLKRLKATPKAKQEFYKRDGKYGKKGDPRPGTRLRDEGKQEFKERVKEYIVENADTIFRREVFEDVPDYSDDVKDLNLLINTGMYPRNPNSCFIGRQECEFRPVCLGHTSLSNCTLYKKVEDPLDY